MKYIVTGNIKGGANFNIEIDAESENHAKQIAISNIGGRQRIRLNQIKIDMVKVIKEEK
ncbi:MAG: 50S ribosomal protein L18a [Candidatus Marsarchaeota archaeon]|nr:50S ribosomal protein L18a [Candidatus Marsarchaeota archaeon]